MKCEKIGYYIFIMVDSRITIMDGDQCQSAQNSNAGSELKLCSYDSNWPNIKIVDFF